MTVSQAIETRDACFLKKAYSYSTRSLDFVGASRPLLGLIILVIVHGGRSQIIANNGFPKLRLAGSYSCFGIVHVYIGRPAEEVQYHPTTKLHALKSYEYINASDWINEKKKQISAESGRSNVGVAQVE